MAKGVGYVSAAVVICVTVTPPVPKVESNEPSGFSRTKRQELWLASRLAARILPSPCTVTAPCGGVVFDCAGIDTCPPLPNDASKPTNCSSARFAVTPIVTVCVPSTAKSSTAVIGKVADEAPAGMVTWSRYGRLTGVAAGRRYGPGVAQVLRVVADRSRGRVGAGTFRRGARRDGQRQPQRIVVGVSQR